MPVPVGGPVNGVTLGSTVYPGFGVRTHVKTWVQVDSFAPFQGPCYTPVREPLGASDPERSFAMPADIVTLGVACADVMVRPVDTYPERGKLTLVPSLEIHLGGLAAVTAVVASRLGHATAFVGVLGNDGFGDFIAETLERAGVDTAHIRRAPDCHTSATAVLIDSAGERTFLHHVGSNAALDESVVDFSVVKEARVLHWGGPAVTPGLDGAPMGRVFERARALGVTTSMDTCFDGNGTWLPRIEPALPHLDIVMSSFEEACHYTGCKTPEDIAAFYRSYGPSTVMVKLGDQGVYVQNANEEHRVPAHRVHVVDTTGAGDAACAGFLSGLLRGWDLLACARLANAVGASTVQVMGGSEGVESFEQVYALMEADSYV